MYKVRKKSGEICFDGDLPTLKEWLHSQRITSDDEIQRQGLCVLKGDELWSLVKDCAELGFDPAVERARLRRLRLWLFWGSLISALTFLLAAMLIYSAYISPTIDVELAKKSAEQSNIDRITELKSDFEDKLDEVNQRLSLNHSNYSKEVESLRTQISQSMKSTRDLDAKITQFNSRVNEHSEKIGKFDSRLAALEASRLPQTNIRMSNTPQSSEAPKSQLASINSALISISWTDTSVPGYKFIQVTNKTNTEITISLSFYLGNSPILSYVSIPAGQTYDSSMDDFISAGNGGRRAFISGRQVTISFNRDESWRGRAPIVVITP